MDRTDLAAMAEALAASGDYRVLRRLVPRTSRRLPRMDGAAKQAIILDVETTGLDPKSDEVIELGMVKFDYLSDGSIAGVQDVFTAFNEPSIAISPEVTALTGITAEMGRVPGRGVTR
ncbi:DNA polymerase III epsilon subunit-like protein [Bradyrhizobium sp. USDA 4369]